MEVRPADGNKWIVTSVDKPSRSEIKDVYDAVMICNGHYNDPIFPKLPGHEKFRGIQSHSQQYRSPDGFKGQRVLVIGAGPSGLDLALHLSTVASHVSDSVIFFAARREARREGHR